MDDARPVAGDRAGEDGTVPDRPMSGRTGGNMFGRRRPPPEQSTADEASPDHLSPGDEPAGPRPTGPMADASARRLQHAVIEYSRWTLRLLIIGVGLVAVFWVLGRLWSVLLPIFFGLLLATILWPPVRFMRRRLPNALAALLALVGLLVIMGGLIAALAPQVTSEAGQLVDRATAGLTTLQTWLAGPPFNLGPDALGGLLDQGIAQLQSNSQQIVTVVLGSLGAIGSAIVTLVLALVLCFFFLKDGPKFVPWLRTWIGRTAGRHFSALSDRVWTALGQYVWSQAAVAAIDGIFIGLGVWILGVPFALPIAVLTFFGGFVPIVGAFVAGSVAVLVALVSNGIWTAVGVLAIVLVVQQLEGNVMQPIMVGKTMNIHAAVTIAVVALGGTLFGIVGAFLAVPAVAVVQVVARYVREQLQTPQPASGPPPALADTDRSEFDPDSEVGTGIA
jgi:predicted PurR-regulated permease PerM